MFICPKCGFEDGLPPDPHECAPGAIEAHVRALEDCACKSERHLRDIQETIALILSDVPLLDGTVGVDGQLLKKLWLAAKCHEAGTNDPVVFLARWIALTQTLSAARSVFRPTRNGRKATLCERLAHLHEITTRAYQVLFGERGARPGDLSVDEVLAEASKETR